MSAYYNEHDPQAAAWLRELIKRGLIAPREVDERSIVDVRPDDLRGFTQCHFFAGIGTWSYALRQAGWPDDRPVWTGSPPCQPFSAAGKGAGKADARHLAPTWLRLVGECRPAVLLGEQVDAAVRFGWLDDLFVHLENIGYSCGAVSFPSASIGAPHIRQRLYFMAHAAEPGREERQHRPGEGGCASQQGARERQFAGHGATGVMAHAISERGCGWNGERQDAMDADARSEVGSFWSDAIWLPCRDGKLRPTGPGIHPLVASDTQRARFLRTAQQKNDGENSGAGRGHDVADEGGNDAAAAIGGSVKSSPLPLADGPSERVVRGGGDGAPFDPNATAEARVMRLRGYGNAIVAPAATAFIRAAMECL